jgi:hypothetical protein
MTFSSTATAGKQVRKVRTMAKKGRASASLKKEDLVCNVEKGLQGNPQTYKSCCGTAAGSPGHMSWNMWAGRKFSQMYSRFLASRSQLNTWLCEIRIACKLNIGASKPEQSVPTRKSVAVLPATFSMSCRKRSPHVFKCCSNAKGMTIGGETLRGVAAQASTLLGVAAQATFGARAGRPEPVPSLGRFPEGDGPSGGRLNAQVIEPKPYMF